MQEKTAAVVAFAFGVPDWIRPNRRIAEIAERKSWQLGRAPVYTQGDVLLDPGVPVKRVKEDAGHPPPTLRMARGAVRWAIRMGFRELWVSAASPHLWRCLRDLKMAAREAGADIKIGTCEWVSHYPEEQWFDSDSTQERTRSRENWEKRERILKWMPFWLYKLVAS